jgi:CheY-like chemotaxis protein
MSCEENAAPDISQTRFASDQVLRNDIGSLRVLVAEDNLVNQRLATRLLEKKSHRVIIAENGLQALAALERAEQENDRFDLILMDVQMPLMDGMEATARIRERERLSGLLAQSWVLKRDLHGELQFARGPAAGGIVA